MRAGRSERAAPWFASERFLLAKRNTSVAYVNVLPAAMRSPSPCRPLRCSGDGPVFIKRSGAVLYDPDDLDAWLEASKLRSTSGALKGIPRKRKPASETEAAA